MIRPPTRRCSFSHYHHRHYLSWSYRRPHPPFLIDDCPNEVRTETSRDDSRSRQPPRLLSSDPSDCYYLCPAVQLPVVAAAVLPQYSRPAMTMTTRPKLHVARSLRLIPSANYYYYYYYYHSKFFPLSLVHQLQLFRPTAQDSYPCQSPIASTARRNSQRFDPPYRHHHLYGPHPCFRWSFLYYGDRAH